MVHASVRVRMLYDNTISYGYGISPGPPVSSSFWTEHKFWYQTVGVRLIVKSATMRLGLSCTAFMLGGWVSFLKCWLSLILLFCLFWANWHEGKSVIKYLVWHFIWLMVNICVVWHSCKSIMCITIVFALTKFSMPSQKFRCTGLSFRHNFSHGVSWNVIVKNCF